MIKSQMRQRWLALDGERLPLTSIEVTILKHALEAVAAAPALFRERIAEGSASVTTLPAPQALAASAVRLHRFLLTGVRGDKSPTVVAWRAERLAADTHQAPPAVVDKREPWEQFADEKIAATK